MQKILSTGVMMVFFCLTACSFYPNLTWKPDVFAPVAKGAITLEDAISTNNLTYSLTVTLPVSVPAGNVKVPPFGPVTSSTESLTLQTVVSEVVLDTLKVSAIITNPMPVAVSAGTEVVFRANLSGKELFRLTLSQPLAAGQTLTTTFSQTNITLTPSLTVTFENVSSPGSGTQTVNFNGSKPRLQANFTLGLVKVRSITINKNLSDFYEDESDFEIGLDAKDSIQGKLIINTLNGFPLNLALQGYLLDANKNVLDSLFSKPFVLPAGTPQNPVASTADITAIRIVRNLQKTKFLRTRAYYTTANKTGPTTITSDSRITYQLTGDLKIIVKP
jgi:hypothetical protein